MAFTANGQPRHYLGDKQDFDVASEGHSSGICKEKDEEPLPDTSKSCLSPR